MLGLRPAVLSLALIGVLIAAHSESVAAIQLNRAAPTSNRVLWPPRMPRSRAQAAPPPGHHRLSTADCDWKYYTQPLSHFAEGSTVAGNATFSQRVCIIDKHWEQPAAELAAAASGERAATGPILFCKRGHAGQLNFVCNSYQTSNALAYTLVYCRYRQRESDR